MADYETEVVRLTPRKYQIAAEMISSVRIRGTAVEIQLITGSPPFLWRCDSEQEAQEAYDEIDRQIRPKRESVYKRRGILVIESPPPSENDPFSR